MQLEEAIATRWSCSQLAEPIPTPNELNALLTIALNAPDHGLLRPWTLWCLRGEQREQLGAVFCQAALLQNPQLTAVQLANISSRPLRAPLIIIVAAKITPAHKIPEIEQIMSAATLAHNIQLLLHAKGYASIWRTGEWAYDAHVKQTLALNAHDQLIGYLYVGTAATPPPITRPSITLDAHLKSFTL
jgi:nitroreductase